MDIQIQITGLQEALQALENLKGVATGLQPEIDLLGQFLMDYFTNQVFDSEGGVLGDPWVALSEKYAIWKARKYPGAGILVATGTLRASWKLYTSADSLILRNEAMANGRYYGAAHQNGAGNLPQRKIMDFNDDLLNQIRDMVIGSLSERIQGAIL